MASRARSGSGAYFGPSFFGFLRDLAAHNDRGWFTAHKPDYEAAVQDPALRFITEMGSKLAALSPHLVADARPFGGSLSRIYRDTRFSRDKSPYKTHVGIHFSHDGGGTKGEHLPGFFVHLAPGESAVYAGIWRPEPPMADRIRTAIAAPRSSWAKVRSAGIAMDGESYARVPSGFDPDHRYAEDLKRKDFTAGVPLRDADVTSPKFGAVFVTACRSLAPLDRFLAGAIGVPW